MLKRALIGTIVMLALPASATAAMSHTWVSGTGDDANAAAGCSRTAPCKTFAGAYAITLPGGEISVLDPGSYGPLTITQAVTIDGNGEHALVTPGVADGFTVAAGASDHVVIKGIYFVGDGAGLDAVSVNSAASVEVQSSDISGFSGNGVADRSTGTHVDVSNTSLHDNGGDGILLAPPGGGTGSLTAQNDTINGNACGVVATAFGMPTSPAYGSNCGVNSSGTPSGSTTLTTLNSSIIGNAGAGVLANGSASTDYIQGDTVAGNGVGLQELNSGQIVWVGENWVYDNSNNGAPTSSLNAGPGAQGPQGARGQSGQVDIVKCKTVIKKVKKHGKKHKKKVRKCTAKLVSGNVKFKVKGQITHATLARGGVVYAVGTMVSDSGGSSEAILSPERRLRAGRYVLTLRENGRVVGRRSVSVS